MLTTKQRRIAKGQCPLCGQEAAPFYLCGKCRMRQRLDRALKKGARCGVLSVDGTGEGRTYTLARHSDEQMRAWSKNGTQINLPDTDRRGSPRVRGVRIDVEETLLEIMKYLERPSTIDEIMMAWGRLRSHRQSPLPADLARIIIAADRRKAKAAKRAAQMNAASHPTGATP